jgi:hypothetical protein
MSADLLARAAARLLDQAPSLEVETCSWTLEGVPIKGDKREIEQSLAALTLLFMFACT